VTCFQGNVWPDHSKAAKMLLLASLCLSVRKNSGTTECIFVIFNNLVVLHKFVIAFPFLI
jgi:hypothetical protein